VGTLSNALLLQIPGATHLACRPRHVDAQPVALLLADLAVTKSHSRPHVSDRSSIVSRRASFGALAPSRIWPSFSLARYLFRGCRVNTYGQLPFSLPKKAAQFFQQHAGDSLHRFDLRAHRRRTAPPAGSLEDRRSPAIQPTFDAVINRNVSCQGQYTKMPTALFSAMRSHVGCLQA
jgi:hypothetical protein